MKQVLIFFALTLATHLAQAANQRYIFSSSGATGISFRLPYTGGTHTGSARSASGTLTFDPSSLIRINAHIVVPIDDIHSGDSKRDCHMREALGLDYTRSQFPKSHVCDNANRIPTSGPDSVVYPTIEFI